MCLPRCPAVRAKTRLITRCWRHNPAEFYVGACDARTGQSVYFSKSCLKKDQYDIFKGSCALPLFCKPYVVDGIPCLDGGISDPVPVLKAFEDGCDKVVLILTRPVDQKREQKKDVMPARLLAKAYPKAAERLLDRYRAYNDGVEIAKEYQKLLKGRTLNYVIMFIPVESA